MVSSFHISMVFLMSPFVMIRMLIMINAALLMTEGIMMLNMMPNDTPEITTGSIKMEMF